MAFVLVLVLLGYGSYSAIHQFFRERTASAQPPSVPPSLPVDNIVPALNPKLPAEAPGSEDSTAEAPSISSKTAYLANASDSNEILQGKSFTIEGITYRVLWSQWCGAVEYRGQVSRTAADYLIVSLAFKNNDANARGIHILDLRDEKGASLSRARNDILDNDGDLATMAMVVGDDAGTGRLFFDCEHGHNYSLTFTALGGKVLATVRLQPTEIQPEPVESQIAAVPTQSKQKPSAVSEDNSQVSTHTINSHMPNSRGYAPSLGSSPLTHQGPRGGIYHISPKSGKKVYEKKRY